MASDPRGHTVPQGIDTPRRAAINDLSSSINDVIQDENLAAAQARVNELVQAEIDPEGKLWWVRAERRLLVYRGGAFRTVLLDTDATDYYRLSVKTSPATVPHDTDYIVTGLSSVQLNFPTYANGVFTIPATGMWDLRGSVDFSAPSGTPSGDRLLRIFVNSTAMFAGRSYPFSGRAAIATAAAYAVLNEGDEVTFRARHGQGTSLQVGLATNTTFLQLRRVGPIQPGDLGVIDTGDPT